MSTPTLRMSLSTAARVGVPRVTAAAVDQRVVLTRLGRPVAVVDSAERLDEDLRRLRDGVRSIVEAFAAPGSGHEGRPPLADVCAQLDLDESRVRERAAQLRSRAGGR